MTDKTLVYIFEKGINDYLLEAQIVVPYIPLECA